MRVAITGGTGFVGRYVALRLAEAGHELRLWHRHGSDRGGLEAVADHVEWVPGGLGDSDACRRLVSGCEAVVHAALDHPGGGFRGGEGELLPFVRTNVLGTLELVEAAGAAGVGRLVFVSTCAVYETILPDRPLDEAHPLWPGSHYGAHKAAIEAFVSSYGRGQGYGICALRPTGVYGLARPVGSSKWFELVRSVVRGEDVTCSRGGKEVHAADVAKAVEILLGAEGIAGEVFNCYDFYISEYDVATLAKELSGGRGRVLGGQTSPKHQIEAGKLRSLGMEFGGRPLLEETVRRLVEAAR